MLEIKTSIQDTIPTMHRVQTIAWLVWLGLVFVAITVIFLLVYVEGYILIPIVVAFPASVFYQLSKLFELISAYERFVQQPTDNHLDRAMALQARFWAGLFWLLFSFGIVLSAIFMLIYFDVFKRYL